MTDSEMPCLLWLRRDLRLSDHPALTAAVAEGAVIPVFILDPQTEALGAAPRWRLEQSLVSLAKSLAERGSRLIVRKGAAADVLEDLIAETGARAVHWSRLYDPVSKERDTDVKSRLKARGISACSHPGHLLREPWTVETKTGGFYKVYTPYWKAMAQFDMDAPLPTPKDIRAPGTWPQSLEIADLGLGRDMQRGAQIVAEFAVVGEQAAQGRLGAFLAHGIDGYNTARDRTDAAGTSGLSENLTYGEIGIRTVWHAALRAREEGRQGAETFLKELVWRDFAWHLIHHTPHIVDQSWREEWQTFPWRDDNDDAERWRRGLTGEPMVDAGMRQMYITGTMHNRVRMLVASYLTKHLMTHWRVGQKWFEECLIDWDPASNAMGWQWAAGSGPDASPYFRIFNPETQAEKFDPKRAYRRRFIAGYGGSKEADAMKLFDAIPRSWNMSAGDPYPDRMVDLKAGRERALEAYQKHKAA
jgi:deoxyribodipyrimidine photo-lyase